MAFNKIQSVETPEFYLNTAFSRARKEEKSYRSSLRKTEKSKRIIMVEKHRFNYVQDYFKNAFHKLVSSFPSTDQLSEFYNELLGTYIDIDEFKKSLSTISWAASKVDELARMHSKKLKQDMPYNEVLKVRKSFYGRVSSVIKRLEKHLLYLKEARKIIVGFPVVKDNLFTVCITGFPNAGKSTLLSRITAAKPGIGEYAFTTKNLNLGYASFNNRNVQFIDCPGTLARPEKMNYIEKQAYLAVKYLADVVVFVYDLTGEYSLEEQDALLKVIKGFDKQIIFFVSKADILGEDDIKGFVFSREEKFISSVNSLKDEISASLKDWD